MRAAIIKQHEITEMARLRLCRFFAFYIDGRGILKPSVFQERSLTVQWT